MSICIRTTTLHHLGFTSYILDLSPHAGFQSVTRMTLHFWDRESQNKPLLATVTAGCGGVDFLQGRPKGLPYT